MMMMMMIKLVSSLRVLAFFDGKPFEDCPIVTFPLERVNEPQEKERKRKKKGE